jgi:solute carrier family 25 phosphate transporter 23/24/25/41
MPRVRRPRALGPPPALASLSQSQARPRDGDASVSRSRGTRRLEARDRTSSASTSGSSPGTRSSNPLAHLLAGAVGGALSRTATAPIQTVRLRMVAGAMDGTAAAKGGLAGEIALLARREGWRALFRGNLANVVRFAPTTGLDFFTFKVYKEFIGERLLGDARGDGDERGDGDGGDGDGEKARQGRIRRRAARTAQSMAAGALAGLTSTALLFPLDNLTTRLAVGGGALARSATAAGGMRGLVAAGAAVARAEGAGGLYRGLKPALVGIAPEAALTYGIFDLLKERCERAERRAAVGDGETENERRKATPAQIVACAAVASLCGQTFAFPAEAVSRRLTSGAATGNGVAVFRAILEEQGIRGLYRGLGPASIRIVPMAAISFSSYELLHVAFDEALASAGF